MSDLRADVLDDVLVRLDALTTAVACLIEQVALILDVLELDEPGDWREIVDLPDIATYQESP